MNATEFSELTQLVKQLSPKQKKQLEGLLSKPDDMSCITKLLDANVNQSPHCQCDAIDKWGTSGNRQRYRCKSCRSVTAIDSPEPGQQKRIGFLAGQLSIPDDFDRMGEDEIADMFGG